MSLTNAEKTEGKPETGSLSVAEAREIMAYAWPDVWAANHNLYIDSKPFSLAGREYQVDIFRDESTTIICPKGAQMGLTVVFLVKAAHAVGERRWSVLYLLPLKAGSMQFVQGRIDPIIDSSPRLAAKFRTVDNRNQKVTVEGSRWYIRGTNIQSELREIPADVLILDERDVANEDYLGDAYARLDGSKVKRAYELSTPTIDGHGVYGDGGWKDSDQMQWWVPCPACNSKQVLTFEDNVQPHLGDTIEECEQSCRCVHCGHPFTDDERAIANAAGKWVPSNPGASIRGYHISQLNSPTKPLAHPKFGLLVNYFLGATDAGKMRDFFTLGLGLPYAAAGDRFTSDLLDGARRDYLSGGVGVGNLFIGVDQGVDDLHVTLWLGEGLRMRLVRALVVRADKTRKKWQVLDEDVLQRFSSWVCVCDAHPDKEDCEALSKKYSGRFFMGYEKDRPEQSTTANFEKPKFGEAAKVTIDRLMAFDTYINKFLDGLVDLPKDARDLGEHMPGKSYNGFYHQHFQMVRVNQADSADRLVARWVNGVTSKSKTGKKSGNRPDHWHHSSMFAFIASMQSTPLVVSKAAGDLFRQAGNIVVGGRR